MGGGKGKGREGFAVETREGRWKSMLRRNGGEDYATGGEKRRKGEEEKGMLGKEVLRRGRGWKGVSKGRRNGKENLIGKEGSDGRKKGRKRECWKGSNGMGDEILERECYKRGRGRSVGGKEKVKERQHGEGKARQTWCWIWREENTGEKCGKEGRKGQVM